MLWIWEKTPDLWARILSVPNRKLELMVLRDRTACTRRIGTWRVVWRCGSYLSIVLAVTSSPGGSGVDNHGVIFYTMVGGIYVGCTLGLFIWASLRDWLTPWRTSFCGSVCIGVPYLWPGVAFHAGFASPYLRKLVWGGDPWQSDGLCRNGVVCAESILLNTLVCSVPWLFWRLQHRKVR